MLHTEMTGICILYLEKSNQINVAIVLLELGRQQPRILPQNSFFFLHSLLPRIMRLLGNVIGIRKLIANSQV